MWMLQLNMMRNKAESRTNVAYADTCEELKAFVARETEPWIDDSNTMPNDFFDYSYTWHKTFRKGSPLEWYNAPDHDSYIEVVTLQEYLARAERDYYHIFSNLMKV